MSNGADIRYPGNRHGVLLLHGLSSSPLEVRFLARTLADAGFTVHAPILPGYSQDPEAPEMGQWIDAAIEAYDALEARCDRVSLGGLSMGATLALAVAHRRPAVQALVLLSTTLAYDGWAIPWYHFLLDWIYYTPLRHSWRYKETPPFGLKNEALRMKVERAMAKSNFSEIGPATISLKALHEANRLCRHVKRILPQIDRDCLIVHAIDDETASPKNARLVSTQIKSVFHRAIYLDDSYHMITVDNEREIVASEAALFLRESEAASAGDEKGTAPVISKALSRRLRQLAALAN